MKVYCEALQIDDNFLRAYNQSPRISITNPEEALVISAWYRARLGCMSTREDVSIEVRPANSVYGRFMACVHHPQTVVRISTWLGALGLFLGIVGVVLGVLPFAPHAASPAHRTVAESTEELKADTIVLYATLGEGRLSGKAFNQNASHVLTRFIVEAVPRDPNNPFNAGAPSLFEVQVNAQPRAMSPAFSIETGPLNPDFHGLRVVQAYGRLRD